MITDQCISVTDLRTKTKKCLIGLEKEPKYIFVNNKPVAVIIDIGKYEKHFAKTELIEMHNDSVSDGLKKEAAEVRKINKDDLVDI